MGIKGAKTPPMPSKTPQEIAGLIMWFLRDHGGKNDPLISLEDLQSGLCLHRDEFK